MLGQPAQPAALPASSAAGPTHPSFALEGIPDAIGAVGIRGNGVVDAASAMAGATEGSVMRGLDTGLWAVGGNAVRSGGFQVGSAGCFRFLSGQNEAARFDSPWRQAVLTASSLNRLLVVGMCIKD